VKFCKWITFSFHLYILFQARIWYGEWVEVEIRCLESFEQLRTKSSSFSYYHCVHASDFLAFLWCLASALINCADMMIHSSVGKCGCSSSFAAPYAHCSPWREILGVRFREIEELSEILQVNYVFFSLLHFFCLAWIWYGEWKLKSGALNQIWNSPGWATVFSICIV